MIEIPREVKIGRVVGRAENHLNNEQGVFRRRSRSTEQVSSLKNIAGKCIVKIKTYVAWIAMGCEWPWENTE